MTTTTVSSGVTSSGLVVSGGDALVVLSGGEVDDSRILSGGSATVWGQASGAQIESGGEAIVEFGGVATGGAVRSGGLMVLQLGTAVGVTVSSGGTVGVGGKLTSDFTAGAVTRTTVVDGATVLSGGVADLYDAEIDHGVTVSLASGGSASSVKVFAGAVLLGPGDVLGRSTDAGAVSGVVVGDDASLVIQSGGTARAVTLARNSDTTSNDMVVAAGASAADTTVLGGGELAVFGSAAGTVVRSGGEEDVSLGGVVSGDVVESGGLLVMSDATALGVRVQSGGTFDLGGALTRSFIDAPSTATTVVDGVTLSSGAAFILEDATLRSGVTVSLAAGAVAQSLSIERGGVLQGAGTLAGLVTRVDGSISGVAVESELVLYSGATARGVTVKTDNTMVDDAGATATGTVVAGGADLLVAGATLATRVESGGMESVRSGGAASETAVLGGGEAYVYAGGEQIAAVVSSGGAETVLAGGAARGLTVLSGGALIDNGEVRIGGAGTLDGTLEGSGAIIETGGGDLVLGGGGGADFSGKAAIEGGAIELGAAGALGSGAVQFVQPATGAAVLQIDAGDAPAAGGTFANTMLNFSGAGEDIDLGSIAFVTGASATVVGSTLMLTDGGKTYAFKLAGGVADAYRVLGDGHGGTLITPQALTFTQAAAAFAPPGAGGVVLVSSPSPAEQRPFAHATTSANAGLH